MKYECGACGVMCFDGSTDESLPEDIKQHENGYFHKMNSHLSDTIKGKEKCGHDGYCHCDCGLHKENGDY